MSTLLLVHSEYCVLIGWYAGDSGFADWFIICPTSGATQQCVCCSTRGSAWARVVCTPSGALFEGRKTSCRSNDHGTVWEQ